MFQVELENSLSNGCGSLVELFESYKKRLVFCVSDLRGIVMNSDVRKRYELSLLSDDQFLYAILLCLAFSAIDPHLIGSARFSELREFIVAAGKTFDIDPHNIGPISTIELALIEVIDKS